MGQKNKFNQIILNKMYSGGYISDYDNVGHEIINLYKSDNDQTYIFLCSEGQLPKTKQGYEPAMLLIKYIGNNLYRVLGKATGLTTFGDVSNNTDEKIIQFQKEEIKKQKISYGGILLNKIFDQNRFKNNTHSNIYITFKAKKVVKPKENFYITPEEYNNDNTGKKIYKINCMKFGRSLRYYFYKIDEKNGKLKSYNELEKIINNEDLWGEETTIFNPNKNYNKNKGYDLLEIMGKVYDELSYSNLIYYFFKKYPELTKNFVQNALNIKDEELNFNNFIIKREWKKTDIALWIKKDNQNDKEIIIIIENKIKSDISKNDGKTQLEKYYENIKASNKDKSIDKMYFYVLSPDYKDIKLNDKESENWEKIKYSYLLKCLNNFSEIYNFQDDQFNKLLLENFIKSVEKQSKEIDNNLEEKSEWIFNKRILEIKE